MKPQTIADWKLSDMEFLVKTAREAGEAILKVYRTEFKVAYKGDSSPVTEADLRSHEVIAQRLKERHPEVPMLSEENSEQESYEVRKGWELFWLVDPLDGTKEFVKRNGQFTVNIALVQGVHPIVGVVYAPAFDLLYYGKVGEGAFKVEGNATPVSLPERQTRNSDILVVAGSSSHPSAELDIFLAEQGRKYPKIKFVPMGSSLKICMVAEGSADIYPRLGPTMEWDTAAAHAIAISVGRKVVRYGRKDELSYNKECLLNDKFVVR